MRTHVWKTSIMWTGAQVAYNIAILLIHFTARVLHIGHPLFVYVRPATLRQFAFIVLIICCFP